ALIETEKRPCGPQLCRSNHRVTTDFVSGASNDGQRMLDINVNMSTIIVLPSNMMFKTSSGWQCTARPELIEPRQCSRHGASHAGIGAERAEYGFERQQCGRQALGDRAGFMRNRRQLCRDRIAHVDVLA